MGRLEIWVHDHRDGDHQTPGPIIRPCINLPTDPPGENYAGWRSHYTAWYKYRDAVNPPDMIGFFAYRYYLWEQSWFNMGVGGPRSVSEHALAWRAVGPAAFETYRSFLSTWDGAAIKEQLAQCDLLQAAPYSLDPRENIAHDFSHCGSKNDFDAFMEVIQKHGFYEFRDHKLYQFLFITHWPLFDRLMREMEPLRLELHERCNGLDSGNGAYKARVMDYVMERIYPLWLLKSGVKFKEVIKLHRQ